MTSESDHPPISCIIPVRDGARYIGETVASLAGQSLAPAEIIIVDDGSADDSAAIAAAAGGELVRIIRQPPQGFDAARNTGMAAASGELLHFFDADDLAPPGVYRAMAEALRENPAWDGVFGRWENFWIEELAREAESPQQAHLRGVERMLKLTAGLFRKGLAESNGPFTRDHAFNADILWVHNAVSAGARFGRIEKLTLRRRIHRHNLSRRKSNDDLANLVFSLYRRQKARRAEGSEAPTPDKER
ncbi:MAG: glycosyltransferase family 2 protein [Sphingomonadaceae bacterium]